MNAIEGNSSEFAEKTIRKLEIVSKTSESLSWLPLRDWFDEVSLKIADSRNESNIEKPKERLLFMSKSEKVWAKLKAICFVLPEEETPRGIAFPSRKRRGYISYSTPASPPQPVQLLTDHRPPRLLLLGPLLLLRRLLYYDYDSRSLPQPPSDSPSPPHPSPGPNTTQGSSGSPAAKTQITYFFPSPLADQYNRAQDNQAEAE